MIKYKAFSQLIIAAAICFGCNGLAGADQPNIGSPDLVEAANGVCPDHTAKWNMEFGPGTKRLTECIHRRSGVKVLVQINKFCRDEWNLAGERVLDITDCDPGRAYALHNIDNMLNDYESTYGMLPGRDVEVVALVHGEGNHIVLQDGYRFTDTVKGEVIIENPFQDDVEALMARGVRFLFCQNAARNFMSHGDLPSYAEGEGGATDALIPGVEYHTAGMTAMADYQARGYSYIQP